MRKTAFKYLNSYPAAYAAFMKLVEEWEKNTGDSREEFALEKYMFFSSLGGEVPKHVMVGEHQISGPREPDWVWTGSRWICSEMDLSKQEVDLMNAVAKQCPGGLGGWS